MCPLEDRRRSMLGDAELREVALLLRRRHLHAHLEAWRCAQDSLEAARRSREKRARLIRLARKHNLVLCLRWLKAYGFTVSHSCRNPFFQYEPACTQEFLHGLENRLDEFKREWQQMRRQSLDPILANLRSLFEETDLNRSSPYEVYWILSDVYLEDVWIGDLEITMNLEEFQVKVFNQSVDLDKRGGYQHPHVNSSGEICWNGYDEDAAAYHRTGDFLPLKDLITNLLQTYNPSSPYINLDDWEYGLGECCSECGERYCEDDLAYVESLSDVLCPDCRMYCEECDRYVHFRDYQINHAHGWEMCQWCAEEFTACCSECDERFRSEDLHRIEEESEIIHLCEACYKEYLRKEEEDHEDLDDTTSVLAPAVAVSP